jgi:hypothetical protein
MDPSLGTPIKAHAFRYESVPCHFTALLYHPREQRSFAGDPGSFLEQCTILFGAMCQIIWRDVSNDLASWESVV